MPFKVEHDAEETFGLIINHNEVGMMVFITDTYQFRYEIEESAHWIIEANYDEEVGADRRVINSHMSIQEAVKTLRKFPNPKSISLIHLSDRNSNSQYFKEYTARKTGIMPVIADKNVVIKF